MQHVVKFYEKGDRPLEVISSRQWFVKTLDVQGRLCWNVGEQICAGTRGSWGRATRAGSRGSTRTGRSAVSATSVCRSRCGTRSTSDGEPVYDEPILPDEAALPIDPLDDVPPGYTAEQRG